MHIRCATSMNQETRNEVKQYSRCHFENGGRLRHRPPVLSSLENAELSQCCDTVIQSNFLSDPSILDAQNSDSGEMHLRATISR
jgi:hypothetical protein